MNHEESAHNNSNPNSDNTVQLASINHHNLIRTFHNILPKLFLADVSTELCN